MNTCLYCHDLLEEEKKVVCPKCWFTVLEQTSALATERVSDLELNSAAIAALITARDFGHTGEVVRNAALRTLVEVSRLWEKGVEEDA